MKKILLCLFVLFTLISCNLGNGESKFYYDHLVTLSELENKIDNNSELETLIVIYIREKNDSCNNCKTQEKYLEEFFLEDHSNYESKRPLTIAVLDIASDEFLSEEDRVNYGIIKDHIEKYSLDYAYEELKNLNSHWASNGVIDVSASDSLSTPCIARFDGNECVAIKMGYSKNDTDFINFCYYDSESNFNSEFTYEIA